MAKAMKSKAMKKKVEKKQKAEEETDDEEEEAEDSSSSEEEEGAEEEESSSEEEDGEDEEEDEESDESEDHQEKKKEEQANKNKSIRKEANAGKSEFKRCQRTITKLENKQKDLSKRMQENKALIRKAEKEMEEVKAVYSRKKRALNKIVNDKKQVIEERKAKFASRARKAQNKRVKAATKRLAVMGQRMRGVKGQAEDAKTAFKRAQSKVDEATQLCKALKAKGEHVPENFRDDFSSPHAWKPPGYMAAKALAQAKEVLAKVSVVHKKVSGEFESKDLKRKTSLDLLESIKKKKKGGKDDKCEVLAKIATPTRTRPKSSGSKGKRKSAN